MKITIFRKITKNVYFCRHNLNKFEILFDDKHRIFDGNLLFDL